MIPSSGQIDLLEQLTELWETPTFFFFFTSLLKDVIKRIPMGRHNVKVWEGTKCKSFSPNGYELVHSPGTWMCTPLSPEAPFTPTAVPL